MIAIECRAGTDRWIVSHEVHPDDALVTLASLRIEFPGFEFRIASQSI
jgi:hypothetical protein